MTSIQEGRRFSERFRLSAPAIREFAARSHDANPVHSDTTFARNTRFGSIIASGPHLSSILMGLTATYFSKRGGMLGLDFSFQFRSPIMADEEFVAEWLIVRSRYKETLNGYLVDLRGRIKQDDGRSAVGASGRVLVVRSL